MKGINRDYRPAKLNDEYLAWAKNVVLTENLSSITNEKGSVLHSTLADNIIGVIPVNDKFIVFVKNNTIGVLSETTYTQVLDPNNISSSFNFNDKYPITGTYQFNNKEECIIAFTDNFNKPKVVNIGLLDNPTYTLANDIKDVLMFPEGTPAIMETTILDNGGSLFSGAYNISYAYRNRDVTTTFFQLSSPISITDDSSITTNYDGVLLNTPTSKAIQLNFTGIDTSYEKLVIGIVYRVGSGILANEYFETAITGTTQQVIVTQLTDNILLPEEVVVPKVGYRTIKTLARLNDRLYGANLSVENDVNYQAQANNIKLNWKINRTVNLQSTTDKASQSNRNKVGYIAGEVYAFYIRLWFNDGTYSRAFHIPGRDVKVGDKTNILINGQNIPTYKVTDTVNKDGLSNMGFWENETELYPASFPNLGGQKVRHHRLPSLNYLHKNVYNSSSSFGSTLFPILEIEASNVINLPSNCSHWELLYARRTYSNSTHLVQALGIHSAYPRESTIDTSRVWTSGGNWNLESKLLDNDNMIVNSAGTDTYNYLRLNSPDVQTGKPTIPNNGVLIRPEYLMTITSPVTKTEINGVRRVFVKSDYLNGTTTSAITSTPKMLINNEYLNNNSIGVNSNYYNVRGEYTLQIESNENLNFGNNTIGTNTITTLGNSNTPITEKAYVVSLIRFPLDCYNSFYLQDTIQTGKLIPSNTNLGRFLSGDGFITDYSYISFAKLFPTQTTELGDAFSGIRAVHRYILQSPFNYNLRYENNQPYSKYFPKSDFPDIFGDENEYPNDIEPNQVIINREDSFNEVTKASAIYNPEDDIITKYPLRIIRSEIFNAESSLNNWKQYLPNDYYEQKERSRGEIVNIEGFNNNLIIHQERGLFITTERTKLDTSQQAVTLGTGDIFDVIPQEILPNDVGYAGTRHLLGTNMSKIGYSFVDAQQGKVFLYNGQLNEISNTGLRNFFQEHLVQKETIVEQITKSIPKTYNTTLNITTIPKFQLEYTIQGIIYYDIIPPNGYTSSDDYYYTVGDDTGINPVSLTVLKRFNQKVYQDNPFKGNGFSMTYDEEYSRLLLLKTKDCNQEITTQQATLTRTRYLNTASRIVGSEVTLVDIEAYSGVELIQERIYPLDVNFTVFFVDITQLGLNANVELIHNGITVGIVNTSNPSNNVAEFEAATGIIYALTVGATHRVWMQYTSADILLSNVVTVKITNLNPDPATDWEIAVYKAKINDTEYYNGTTWQSSFVQWVTNTQITVLDLPEIDSSIPFTEWFNGTTYQSTATTYTQWFDGVTYQDYFTTYLNCNSVFLLEGRILGYFPVENPQKGDIVIVETSPNVFEYKEYNGTTTVKPTLKDEFLLSYSPANNMWVSNHTPKVKYLTSTYDRYYSLLDNEIYLMNYGERGSYFVGGTTINDSAFIDVIFNSQNKTLFSSFQWITEVFDENDSHYYNETVDKIRVYSNTQTTNQINLVPLKNVRRGFDRWSFNNVRDDNNYNRKFNKSELDNLELIESEIQNKLAHRRGRFITDVCIVRLEITKNKQVIIHKVFPIITQEFR